MNVNELLKSAPQNVVNEFLLTIAIRIEWLDLNAKIINAQTDSFLKGQISIHDLKRTIDEESADFSEFVNTMTATQAMAITVALNAARAIAGNKQYIHTVSNNVCHIVGRIVRDNQIKKDSYQSQTSEKAGEDAEKNEEAEHLAILNSILNHGGSNV